jgi:hypothetical protein
MSALATNFGHGLDDRRSMKCSLVPRRRQMVPDEQPQHLPGPDNPKSPAIKLGYLGDTPSDTPTKNSALISTTNNRAPRGNDT